MNGWRSSLKASTQASGSPVFFGGVWGSTKLNAASSNDAMPAAMNVNRTAAVSVCDLPRASFNQFTKPPSPIEGPLSKATRKNTNARQPAIQQIVPKRRPTQKSRDLGILANAIELVMEIAGT